jgi:hypothetical protein
MPDSEEKEQNRCDSVQQSCIHISFPLFSNCDFGEVSSRLHQKFPIKTQDVASFLERQFSKSEIMKIR